MFENNGHIHVFSPRVGDLLEDNLLQLAQLFSQYSPLLQAFPV